MGSKKQTVGYWYYLLLHFGLGRGVLDAFLAFRGGDRDAWTGEMTQSGTIYVDAPNLWGGEKSEGGIQGECDIMMGEADQQPNAYLAANLGSKQSAYRGRPSIVFKGGKFGAFNPYPKPAAFKVRRILKGWDNDTPWYPEKAVIGMLPGKSLALYFALDLSGSMNDVVHLSGTRLDNAKIAINGALDYLLARVIGLNGARVDVMVVGWGNEPSVRTSILRHNCTAADIAAIKAWVNACTASYATYFPAGLVDCAPFFAAAGSEIQTAFFITDGQPTTQGGSMTALQIAEAAQAIVQTLVGVKVIGINIDLELTTYTKFVDNTGNDVRVVSGADPNALTAAITANLGGLLAMNAAHILYDSVSAADMAGEPTALINDASFRAAADKLYAEGFGLCTEYVSTNETVEAFQQRICNVISARLNKSIVDGLWYLDLIRGDYDIDALPVLTDDDILEFTEQPSSQDGAVNQVSVKWFDPEQKEDRTTAPLQALGAIRTLGRVIAETVDYSEIPTEALALRAGAGVLKGKATPLRKHDLVTTRVAYAWRPGQQFRLQAPKRGIADMVCMVGEKDSGTLKSGAIRFDSVQDVFGMPDSVYVQPEPGVDTSTPQTPSVIALQRAFEVPYVELAGTLSAADLGALAADAAFLAAVATDPNGELNYSLFTAAGGDYADQGVGEWCPTGVIAAAATKFGKSFALTDGRRLDEVVVGSAALWDDEIVRVDALNVTTGAITLGRGCADTVEATHAAGSRIWFYDADAAADQTEYTDGETVNAKLLPNTSSQQLALPLATTLSVTMVGRAARPYPPHQLTVNGSLEPEEVTGNIALAWVHRDRLLQADTLVDGTQASIGPESGTVYDLRVRAVATGSVLLEQLGVDGATASVPASTFESSMVVRIEVTARRDGLTSLQSQSVTFRYSAPGGDMAFVSGYTPPTGTVDLQFTTS